MRLGTREIGAGHPCAVVAELSNAHNGSFDRMRQLLRAAAHAGADVLKVQCYTAAELVTLRGDGPAPAPWGTHGYTMRTLYEQAQTPLAWFPEIARECDRLGIPWFSSVFGPESLATLETVGCGAYKVSHLDCGDERLADIVVATRKPIIVSVADIPAALGYARAADVEYLDCTPEYPTPVGAVHLAAMGELWGLSSHCRDPLLGPVAVARGAHYFEVHVQLAEEPSVLERAVSFTQYELFDLITQIRRAECLLG